MLDIEETNVGAHALLVTKSGDVILQQRDDRPGIVNPGMLSMFGGTLLKTESLQEGLKRELFEELELEIEDSQISNLGVFHKTKELDGLDWEITVFVVRNVHPNELVLHEGKGFLCDKVESLLNNNKITRITKLAIHSYIADTLGN